LRYAERPTAKIRARRTPSGGRGIRSPRASGGPRSEVKEEPSAKLAWCSAGDMSGGGRPMPAAVQPGFLQLRESNA